LEWLDIGFVSDAGLLRVLLQRQWLIASTWIRRKIMVAFL
jgi:hypothetical protein